MHFSRRRCDPGGIISCESYECSAGYTNVDRDCSTVPSPPGNLRGRNLCVYPELVVPLTSSTPVRTSETVAKPLWFPIQIQYVLAVVALFFLQHPDRKAKPPLLSATWHMRQTQNLSRGLWNSADSGSRCSKTFPLIACQMVSMLNGGAAVVRSKRQAIASPFQTFLQRQAAPTRAMVFVV